MITPKMIWDAAEVIRSSPDGLGATELARRVLEAAERAAWRPESEARDGSRMLVCFPPIRRPRVNWGHVRIGRWAGASWHLDMAGNCRSDVTFVRPLPSPPEAPKGEE